MDLLGARGSSAASSASSEPPRRPPKIFSHTLFFFSFPVFAPFPSPLVTLILCMVDSLTLWWSFSQSSTVPVGWRGSVGAVFSGGAAAIEGVSRLFLGATMPLLKLGLDLTEAPPLCFFGAGCRFSAPSRVVLLAALSSRGTSVGRLAGREGRFIVNRSLVPEEQSMLGLGEEYK